MNSPYGPHWNEGDRAIVTTKSGDEFEAVYTLAPGIDFFWNPVDRWHEVNYFIDPILEARPV